MKAWIFAILSGVVTWFVVGSIPNMFGNYGVLAAVFVLIIGPFAGFKVGAFVRERIKYGNG